ncbi:MAG TPA: hypothetical protein DCE44_03890 [Verrucomicrobiales bacterium]|nr:hypothetical protein [Verrucomicrobiales bacterium]
MGREIAVVTAGIRHKWRHRFEATRWVRGVCFAVCYSAFFVLAGALTNSTALPVPPALKDIKGPIVISSTWAWIWRVLAIAAVAGLIALAWWWYRRGQPETAPAAVLSPADRARQRLEAALRWIEDPERFVTEVSEIARTYLEERFGLHAPERTTEEFLAELTSDRTLEGRHKELLADFLTRCDLVKFARADTDRAELEALYGAAERLVDETAKMPSVPPVAVRP